MVGTAVDFSLGLIFIPSFLAVSGVSSKQSSVKCSQHIAEYLLGPFHLSLVLYTCRVYAFLSLLSMGNLKSETPFSWVLQHPNTIQFLPMVQLGLATTISWIPTAASQRGSAHNRKWIFYGCLGLNGWCCISACIEFWPKQFGAMFLHHIVMVLMVLWDIFFPLNIPFNPLTGI